MNRPTEKQVVARLMYLYKAVGCVKIASTQQTRRSRQTVGLPDLYLLHPRIGGWWHEAKRPGGKQTPEQRAFQECCDLCNVGYVLGGYDEALNFLRGRGLVVVGRE